MAQLIKSWIHSPSLSFEQSFGELTNSSPQCFNPNPIKGRYISGGEFSHLMEHSFIHEGPVQSTFTITINNRNIRAKFNQNFSGFDFTRIDGNVYWCAPKCTLRIHLRSLLDQELDHVEMAIVG